MEELLETLGADALERLKWRVLRAFGILPGSEQARALRDADYVLCGLHMLLDSMEAAQRETVPGAGNPAFDPERFNRLKEGETL